MREQLMTANAAYETGQEYYNQYTQYNQGYQAMQAMQKMQPNGNVKMYFNSLNSHTHKKNSEGHNSSTNSRKYNSQNIEYSSNNESVSSSGYTSNNNDSDYYRDQFKHQQMKNQQRVTHLRQKANAAANGTTGMY